MMVKPITVFAELLLTLSLYRLGERNHFVETTLEG